MPSVIHDLPFPSEQGRRRILGGNVCALFGLPTGKRAPKTAADVGMNVVGAAAYSSSLS